MSAIYIPEDLKEYEESKFKALETKILYEIYKKPTITQSELINVVNLDKNFIFTHSEIMECLNFLKNHDYIAIKTPTAKNREITIHMTSEDLELLKEKYDKLVLINIKKKRDAEQERSICDSLANLCQPLSPLTKKVRPSITTFLYKKNTWTPNSIFKNLSTFLTNIAKNPPPLFTPSGNLNFSYQDGPNIKGLVKLRSFFLECHTCYKELYKSYRESLKPKSLKFKKNCKENTKSYYAYWQLLKLVVWTRIIYFDEYYTNELLFYSPVYKTCSSEAFSESIASGTYKDNYIDFLKRTLFEEQTLICRRMPDLYHFLDIASSNKLFSPSDLDTLLYEQMTIHLTSIFEEFENVDYKNPADKNILAHVIPNDFMGSFNAVGSMEQITKLLHDRKMSTEAMLKEAKKISPKAYTCLYKAFNHKDKNNSSSTSNSDKSHPYNILEKNISPYDLDGILDDDDFRKATFYVLWLLLPYLWQTNTGKLVPIV